MTGGRFSPGYSLLEALFALALASILGGIAFANVSSALDDFRTQSAVRFVAGQMQFARATAVAHSANTAFRFTGASPSFNFRLFEDGNGDGVRSRDIDEGVDRPLGFDDRLSRQFPGVDFGVLADLPGADGSPPPAGDPIKLGASNMTVFTPLGTASSGSLYVLGPRQLQYVVRIYGETGRTRILKFNPRTRSWRAL
jgi:type II secretory pathway pseudopilin PulG